MRLGYPNPIHTPKTPPARFWRAFASVERWTWLKVWQIPTPAPKPPREARPRSRRSWVFFLRGVWLFAGHDQSPKRRSGPALTVLKGLLILLNQSKIGRLWDAIGRLWDAIGRLRDAIGRLRDAFWWLRGFIGRLWDAPPNSAAV